MNFKLHGIYRVSHRYVDNFGLIFLFLKPHMSKSKTCLKSLWKNLSDGTLKPRRIILEVHIFKFKIKKMRQIPKKICTMPPFPPLPTPGNISIKIAPSTPTTHGQYLCILKSLFLLSVEIGSKCDAIHFFKAGFNPMHRGKGGRVTGGGG